MSSRSAETIGFVGLGVMGSQIAKRLLDGGYTVHGYNRTRSKAEMAAVIEALPRLAKPPRVHSSEEI
jgi:3-hydroxyisobutyrate dehydrogenase-like beta-hydroxyacid dehydrogenase